MPVYSYDQPERFVAGTVGLPGERTFYLQATDAGRMTSVVCEKEQVAALADRLDELLDEVLRRAGGDTQVPAVMPTELRDDAPLEQPVTDDFHAGTIALAWDADDQVVIVELGSATESDDDEEEDGPSLPEPSEESLLGEVGAAEVLRVRIDPARARAFADRARSVVAAGRPPCPLCGLPLDPQGHVCPRQNGYHGTAA